MPEPVFRSAAPSMAVASIWTSVDWYSGTLGFGIVVTEDGFAMLRRDTVTITLWHADGSVPGTSREFAGSVSCRIEIDGIDALHDHCVAAGCVHPNGALRRTLWDTDEFDVVDPDGNLITFWQSVGTDELPR